MKRITAKIISPFLWLLDCLTPLADLAARFWVAHIFFLSGLSKIEGWQTTVTLFTYEYNVPFLPSKVAAFIGTGAELILPIMLVLGLGGRLMIAAFFIYNIVAVISYPFLWTAQGTIGLYQHINWGLLLMLLMTHGPGKLSVDYFLRKKHHMHLKKTKPHVAW